MNITYQKQLYDKSNGNFCVQQRSWELKIDWNLKKTKQKSRLFIFNGNLVWQQVWLHSWRSGSTFGTRLSLIFEEVYWFAWATLQILPLLISPTVLKHQGSGSLNEELSEGLQVLFMGTLEGHGCYYNWLQTPTRRLKNIFKAEHLQKPFGNSCDIYIKVESSSSRSFLQTVRIKPLNLKY